MDNITTHSESGAAVSLLLAAYALAVNWSDLGNFDHSILVPLMHLTAILAGLGSVLATIRTIFLNKNHK